jgi:D-alanyl-D-alanine dipeptidase
MTAPAKGSWEWLEAALNRFMTSTEETRPSGATQLETYGESTEAVNAVRVVDNGEPLIDVRHIQPPLTFARAHPWGARFRRQFFLRKGVAEKLVRARSLLPEGYRLLIIECYRPRMVQRRLFAGLYFHLWTLFPEWDEPQLREAANVLIADPDIDAPAPHSTGGAVDLTLADSAGHPLEMCAPLGWTEASAPTICERITPEARANRRVMIDALTQAGMTNYAGEWWHWSYGEPGWAVRAGSETAIYGPVENPYERHG